jgi:hypothetical protein
MITSNVKLSDRRTSTILDDAESGSSTHRIALQEIPEERPEDLKEPQHSISDEESPRWKRDSKA